MRTVPEPILILPAIFFLSFSHVPMLPANNPKIIKNIIVIKAKNQTEDYHFKALICTIPAYELWKKRNKEQGDFRV